MTIRSMGASAGFNWLAKGVGVGFRNPRLFGGAAMLVVACLLPSLITMPLQLHAVSTGTPMSPATFGLIMVMSMLIGLLIVPLYAGYLQIVAAAENGQTFGVFDLFKPYRSSEALRLIGFGLAMMLIYFALIAVLLLATGGGLASWYMQMATMQAQHQPPPSLPSGFGWVFALAMLVAIFIGGFYAVSLGQVALSRRSAFGAISDGLIGAFKNMLPMLVFALMCLVCFIGAAVVLVIAFMIVGLLAKLISVWLSLALMAVIYIGLMLIMFTIMFGAMFCMWRDVCGDNAITSTPPPPPFAA